MNRNRYEPWLLAVAVLLPTAVTLGYFRLASAAPPGVQQVVYGAGKTLQFALPVVWVLGALRHRPRWASGRLKPILLGALFGLLVVLLMAVAYPVLRATPLMESAVANIAAKVQDLGVSTPGSFLALGVFYAIVHSLLEEYYWRWFVYGRLRSWMSNAAAVGLSSAGFMLHHIVLLATFFPHSPLAVAVFSLSVMVGGLFWAWLYGRSRSLLGPWASHFLVDAGIFGLGYWIMFA